jgi:flagellar basal-body rod modification protein FlgD
MTTDPVRDSNSSTGGTTSSSDSSNSSKNTSGLDSLANEQTFLRLFVAQLQHQDPSAPQDPTQFVSQLAQLSGLEQSLQMRQDLDANFKTLQTNSSTSTSQTSNK